MLTSVLNLPPGLRITLRRAALVLLTLGVLVAMVVLAVLANASLLAMTACAQTAPERYVVHGTHIDVCDLAGEVRAVPGTGREVEVVVKRGGRDAGRLKVVAGERGDWSTLHVVYPGDRIVYPRMQGGRTTVSVSRDGCLGEPHGSPFRRRVTISAHGFGTEAWADLEVRIPRGLTVALRLGAGEMTATGVDGDLTLDVASASVHTERTRGPLLVDTGSGGVTVRDHQGGDVLVDTGSGGVDIDGLRGERVKLDTGSGGVSAVNLEAEDLLVDTGSGSVEIEGVSAPAIAVDTGSGGVRLALTDSPRSLLVDTGSGGVTILGPAELNAEIELETGSGSIQSDYSVALLHKDHGYLRGTIGSGHGRIHVDTGSGSVSLRQK